MFVPLPTLPCHVDVCVDTNKHDSWAIEPIIIIIFNIIFIFNTQIK